MPRKAEPSFELKKVIWDLAATVGKDKPTDIHRQLDYELEKRRKEEGDFFENTPDVRTISRIVEEINKLHPEVVLSKLERRVWHLRNDYESIKRLAEGTSQTPQSAPKEEKRGLTLENAELVMRHEKKIFGESAAILSENDVRNIASYLWSGNEVYWDMSSKLEKFEWFFSFEGNKYLSDVLRRKCEQFLDSVSKLGNFLGAHFYPAETMPQHPAKSELWIPSHHRYKHNWEEEIWQEYYKLERELHPLTDIMVKAYKSYRAAVREKLFL